jgi:4-hydroxy-4-methyl-2-oxoglutarate aldolase
MPEPFSFADLSPTCFADVLPIEQVMEPGIAPLWPDMPRIAGPAYTVRCAPGDNLMLHAAIYRAEPGSVIVVQAGDQRFAVAGGNVCAVARQRGIAGFVVDGVIRDLQEIGKIGFPIFARGVSPKPGGKKVYLPLNEGITCGGIGVGPGDVIVADQEGIVVIPAARRQEILAAARQRQAADAATPLVQWRSEHEQRIAALLAEAGCSDGAPETITTRR